MGHSNPPVHSVHVDLPECGWPAGWDGILHLCSTAATGQVKSGENQFRYFLGIFLKR